MSYYARDYYGRIIIGEHGGHDKQIQAASIALEGFGHSACEGWLLTIILLIEVSKHNQTT